MTCPKCSKPTTARYTGEILTSSPPLQVWRRVCECGHNITGYDRCDRNELNRPIYRTEPKETPDHVNEPIGWDEARQRMREFFNKTARV